MTGMATNTKKCQCWSNTTKGRKLVQSSFPEMDFVYTVDVLGTKLYTSNQSNYEWNPQKIVKIIQDASVITYLPCKREIREHILATKVISQIHFISQISAIPVKALQDIQSVIAKALWKNRPKWRSKHLLLDILAKPHRVDPFVARAFRTILDTASFLQDTTAENRQLWYDQCGANLVKPHSLVGHFKQACAIFGIEICNSFHLKIENNCVVSFLDFGKRELKNLMEQLCRQSCYRDATKSKRKDIVPNRGFIDFSRTIALYKHSSEMFEGLYISSLLDSAFTGCHTTADRLHSSDLIESDACRFCGNERETIQHITESCSSVDCGIPKPDCPDFGPNFMHLGLVEVPFSQVSNRLSISNLNHVSCVDWYHPVPQTQHFWTDGSVQYPEHFWWTTGGYAVVNARGNTTDAGQVFHPALSSYTTELYSICKYFATAEGPVHIHTDCQAIVTQVMFLNTTGEIKFSWTYISWWIWLRNFVLRRKSFHTDPLIVTWCPSHLADKMPIERISYQLLHDLRTSMQDLVFNRQADHSAKDAASTKHPHFVQLDPALRQIALWQNWLARVQKKLNTPVSERSPPVPPQEPPGPVFLTRNSPDDAFVATFPRWLWYPDPSKPTWKTNLSLPEHFQPPAMLSRANTVLLVDFLSQIQWSLDNKFATSFIELAYFCWSLDVKLENIDHHPSVYTTLIRKAINFCNRRFESAIHPGSIVTKCLCNGKTHPSGYILGADANLPFSARKSLALDFQSGRSQRLSNWAVLFN